MELWENMPALYLSTGEFIYGVLWLVCFGVYAVILYQAQKTVVKAEQNETLPETPLLKISVLVPARNEGQHIKACLVAILGQNDGHIIEEVLVLDDHSSDNTREIVENINHPLIRYVALSESQTGKKAAITLGVKLAKASVVSMTDADCIPNKNWLQSISRQFTHQKSLIFTTGLVSIQDHQNVLSRFQSLDFMANMALTAWGIQHQYFYLANGANMSFRKASFEEVGGYNDNEHIASGDDVFLIKKMAEQKNKTVMFLQDQDVSVVTIPQNTWSSLWEQRKRWATKSKVYTSSALWYFQALTFLLSFGIFGFMMYGAFFHIETLIIPLTFLGIKGITDYLFLSLLSKVWNQKPALQYFFLSFLTYQIYIILMGFTALFPTNYSWKGRTQQ